ncbi:methionine aminotransferase [Lutibacter sp.]|uniref:methionine aminotransferase n=1 Tax=Lutibacter sp. TaxID=1925666 RepID=UPI0025BA6538|nr:methionine aminotransferase [Lutibacter sp.]MCF6168995.1 methionine aminotransferase [Lutibacter sp.]
MSSYKYPFQSKLPTVPTSIFAVMSQLAAKENALNLSQGFPDFKSDKKLIELVNKAMVNGKNQYAPMPGIFSLREAIAEKTENLYGVSYNPDTEITITAGATQAIFTVIAATIQKDDEVIIFKPAYDCYEPSIELFGGKTIAIQLNPEEFSINWQEVKSLITNKTKMIIINTPHNPSGRVLSQKDMLQLEALLKNTNILLLSDEVYEHIIFDSEKHQSAALYPALVERTFIIASFGKTFHNTGWKMGYCIAPTELTKEFRKVHQFNVFSVHHPTQVALAEYLQTPSNYLELGSFYQHKRDLFLSLIKDSRFQFKPSKGTYFQLLNFENITDESDYDFAVRLTKEQKIAGIPISVFNENKYDSKVLRFCFAKTDDTLKKAAEILNRI